MWYEVLPGFGIILVALAVPHYGGYILNKLVLGNAYRRALLEKEQRLGYLRDRRLTHNPYKVSGLEAIPDD